MTYRDPETGRLALAPTDPTTVALRAKVLESLQPGMSPRAAEFWSNVLADHIRNQHRKNAGLEPIVARWDHSRPERVVTIVEGIAA